MFGMNERKRKFRDMREASPEIEEKRQRIEEVCCAKVYT